MSDVWERSVLKLLCWSRAGDAEPAGAFRESEREVSGHGT